MSILDSVLGGLGGQGGEGGMMAIAGQLLQRAGGVQGLQQMLANSGLGDQAASWVGNGANQAVSGDQLGQALEQGGMGDLLGQAAGEMGVDSGTMASQLSDILPQVVSQLTPDGQAPADDGEGMDLSALAGLAGKLF